MVYEETLLVLIRVLETGGYQTVMLETDILAAMGDRLHMQSSEQGIELTIDLVTLLLDPESPLHPGILVRCGQEQLFTALCKVTTYPLPPEILDKCESLLDKYDF